MDFVVIVEPDEMCARNLNDLLESAIDRKFDYKIVLTPDRAVDLFDDRKVDVIISEIELPVLSGIELFSLVERISPQTVRIAMTQANKIKETVTFMNTCKTFKIIIKPCRLAEDIIEPVVAALEYKQMKESIYQDEFKIKDSIFETEEDYRRIEKHLSESGMQYQKMKEILKKLVDINLGFSDIDAECKDMLNNWYEMLFDYYTDFLVNGKGDYSYYENCLTESYHQPNEKKTFELWKKESIFIPAKQMNELAYLISVLSSTVKILVSAYQIHVDLDCSKKSIILEFSCTYEKQSSEEAANTSSLAFKTHVTEAARQFANFFHYKQVIEENENSICIRIAIDADVF